MAPMGTTMVISRWGRAPRTPDYNRSETLSEPYKMHQRQRRSQRKHNKIEDCFEIHGLGNEQHVEGPTTAEVGHNNGVHGHRSEHRLPWSRPQLNKIHYKS
ncbi:hypothetical protein CEXT_582471 [Caerostris extrusa]|uniref:Uncharacterized protein n=1 Tax=Caerostris extrusa TaxID=172846 RepID=A0AAV4PAC6_CAEEX|nr:hypothetical protein CEXT_582471 [Caerostris extrusa]